MINKGQFIFSHMLVSKIKPCMSKDKHLYCETASGSLNQLFFLIILIQFICSLLIGGSIIQPNSNIHMVSRRNHCYNMYEAQKVSLGHPGRCFSIDLRLFTFTTTFFLYCHSYAHVNFHTLVTHSSSFSTWCITE